MSRAGSGFRVRVCDYFGNVHLPRKHFSPYITITIVCT